MSSTTELTCHPDLSHVMLVVGVLGHMVVHYFTRSVIVHFFAKSFEGESRDHLNKVSLKISKALPVLLVWAPISLGIGAPRAFTDQWDEILLFVRYCTLLTITADLYELTQPYMYHPLRIIHHSFELAAILHWASLPGGIDSAIILFGSNLYIGFLATSIAHSLHVIPMSQKSQVRVILVAMATQLCAMTFPWIGIAIYVVTDWDNLLPNHRISYTLSVCAFLVVESGFFKKYWLRLLHKARAGKLKNLRTKAASADKENTEHRRHSRAHDKNEDSFKSLQSSSASESESSTTDSESTRVDIPPHKFKSLQSSSESESESSMSHSESIRVDIPLTPRRFKSLQSSSTSESESESSATESESTRVEVPIPREPSS